MSELISFTKYEFDELPNKGNGFVYIASFDNITKVGCTGNPKTRISTLQITKKRKDEKFMPNIAKMMKKLFDELVKAGFTEEQAARIVANYKPN